MYNFRTNNYLNLREGPNTSTKILGTLPPNIYVNGRVEGDWLHTFDGYLFMSYLEPVADLDSMLPKFAKQYNIELATIKAITQIETGGSGYTNLGPKIRNELHLFARSDNNWRSYIRYDVDRNWLGHELFDGYAWFNPHLNQKNEYRALEILSKVNRKAALSSMSAGIGQIVLGLHFDKLGFKNVETLFNVISISPDVDLFIWLKFLTVFGDAIQYMQNKDWLKFARLYNGSGQAQHYANLMEQQYKKMK